VFFLIILGLANSIPGFGRYNSNSHYRFSQIGPPLWLENYFPRPTFSQGKPLMVFFLRLTALRNPRVLGILGANMALWGSQTEFTKGCREIVRRGENLYLYQNVFELFMAWCLRTLFLRC